MSPELLGVVLALLASLSYESSYVLMTQQPRVVGRCGRPGGRFLVSLLRRPLWVLAIAIDGAGIVLELFALREASLIVVQPLMSVGLIGPGSRGSVALGQRGRGGRPARRDLRQRDRVLGRRGASRRLVGGALAAAHLLESRRGDAPRGRTRADRRRRIPARRHRWQRTAGCHLVRRHLQRGCRRCDRALP